MGTFNLIRYFAIASLGAIGVVAVASAWILSQNLERSLTEEAGLHAVDISRTLNRSIFFEFLMPRMEEGQAIDLEDPVQRAELDRIIESRTRHFRILTVILFDPTATIIYSTNPGFIGYRSTDNPGIAAALEGRPSSVLTRAQLERDPIRPGHDLLESYTPMYELDPTSERAGDIIGVLELYQDARPITRKISEGQRQILLATGSLMGLLFILLFAIVRRGHVRITVLTEALELSNRELEGRVEVRTREIDRARRRLSSLFDGIADGISIIDESYRVSEINSGIERLFGPAAPGGAALCHERYAGLDTPCPSCPAPIALSTGRRAERRYRWPTAEGTRTEVEVTIFPFSTAENERAVIEVVRDVSERSELERQVIRAANLASLGEMAAGVAHEIRNPIGMIQSSAQLLEQTEEISERDRKLLRAIQEETARVSASVSEFVGFASTPAPSMVETDPVALLERVHTMLEPEAQRLRLTLEQKACSDVPPILIDPELIYRALTNLVLNAMQVQGECGWVELATERAGAGTVAIHVSDRGPGIPEEALDQIFQPFFTRRKGGTGLGLSIVQRMVTANNGRIEVDSSADGTRFTLLFSEVGS